MISSALEQCPVCAHSQKKHLYSLSAGNLVSCQHCQLVLFVPRPSPEELAEFYNTEGYREGYEQSPMARQSFAIARYEQLEKAIAHYSPSLLSKANKRFLDIGCGLGDFLSVVAAQGWNITGTEISPKAVQQANSLLGDKVIEGEIINLELPENSYDLITIYHVIEHLLDPVATLVKIRHLLKPEGMAFIETPNMGSLGARLRGKNWSHIIPPEHITYFKPSSLNYALKEAGFPRCKVFTNPPPLIQSISHWPKPAQVMATMIYQVAPLFNLGAALQAVAFKD